MMPARVRFPIAAVVAVYSLFVPAHARATGDLPIDRALDPRIPPPLPIWPSDYETLTQRRPTFRLEGRFAATKYRVELARDAGFTDPRVMTGAKVTDTSGIAPVVLVSFAGEPLADGQYYWRAFCGDDAGFWTPAANYRTFFVFAEDRDAIVPPSGLAHPRLLLSTGEREAIRERIDRSDHLRRGWQYQVNAAYSALELEPPDEDYAKGGVGQHGNYNTCAGWYHRHMENVALVAVLTGDERLARKGVEMLMAACAYRQWVGAQFLDTKHFDPVWSATLETAMMTEAVAIGYDLLYPHLTDAQRHTVREALVEKGVRPLVHDWVDPIGSSRIPRHQLPTGNWVMVCTGSAGLGALAVLGEHAEAPQWTRLVRNRVRAWFHDRGGDWYVDNPYAANRPKPIPVIGPTEPNFGVDGGYKESIGYMNYGTRYACFFADALRRMTGENLFAHVPEKLLHHMAWSILAWPQDGEVRSAVIDFGDEGGTTSWYGDLFAALMKNRKDGLAAWLYRHTNPTPNGPRSILWYDDSLKDAPPEPTIPMGVFRTIGQVVMRRGWSPDAPLAAIKFRQNRGHFDIGNVFLFGPGGPTLIDSGSTNYNSPIYGNYLARTQAHNVVMVDDRPQVRADGQMLAAVGTSLLTATSGQLKAAYPAELKSWTRDLLMLPGGAAIVYDCLDGKGEHRFDLILHPEDPFELVGAGELRIGPGPGKPTIKVFSDAPLKTVLQDGYHQTLPRKYVRFHADAPAEQASFLTLCQWPSAQAPSNVAAAITQLGRRQWRVEHADGSRRATVQAGPVAEKQEGSLIDSDARVAAVVEVAGADDESLHAVVLNGSTLRVRGREWFKATKPIDLSIEAGRAVYVHVWTRSPAQLVWLQRTPAECARLNGAEVPLQRQGDQLTFDLPAGESRLTIGSPEGLPRQHYPADLLAVVAPDAPAFRSDVRTRASSSWTDGIDAIDGNVNTAWISMPGLPMPQWLEVHLPSPEPVSRMELNTGLPCSGCLEAWDPGANDWKPLARFETTADRPWTTAAFDCVEANRLRAVVEKIDPANTSATINSWQWTNPDGKSPRGAQH